MTNDSERRSIVRVGIFVSIGVAILAFGVVLLGTKSGLFANQATLYVSFRDINGLVVGAPVRLAGMDIGRVNKVMFSDDLRQREARVELAIQERYLPRLRSDSRAFIDSKGLLGDKLINITIGDPANPPLREGDMIPARTGLSIEEIATKFNQAVTSITRVSDEAGELLQALSEPQTLRDIQRIVHATAGIMEGVVQGDGVAHRLLYDSAYANDVGAILHESRASLTALQRALARVEHMTAAVEHGPGALHELLYSPDGAQTLANLENATGELAKLMQAVREQPGLLHGLIYEPQSGEMLKQWADFSERVNRLSRSIEQGHGTLGGLLVDPSVYEDLKTTLGNVERNVLFKALIRYTIKEGDIQRPALMPVPKTPRESGADDSATPRP